MKLSMEIFKWLDDQSLVQFYTINDFRNTTDAFYINIRLIFNDESELHYREYLSKTGRKYSFHWQSKIGELIARWDNAPHHSNIETFPHRKHLANGEIETSHDISFEEIIILINTVLNKKPKLL